MANNILKKLKNLITSAKDYQKKLYQEGWFHEKKLPLIIIIGEKKAGKSSLFQDQELAHRFPKEDSAFKWWFTKTAIFFEIEGDASSYNFPEWKKILYTLKKNYNQSINILAIAINAQQLMSDKQKETQPIFKNIIKPLKTVFIITQCDRLNGFIEYFDNLNATETQQSFGIDSIDDPYFTRAVNATLDSLMKKMGDGLLFRLHNEKSIKKRSSIKNFPFLFEMLCNQLKKSISLIPHNHIQLSGIYFTSSVQNKSTATILEKTHTLVGTHSKQKSYFIQKTLERISMLAKNSFHIPKKNKRSKLIALFIAAFIIVMLILTWNHSVNESKKIIGNIQSNLENIELTHLSPIQQKLKQLTILKNTISELNNKQIRFSKWLGLTTTSTLSKKLEKKYQQLLLSFFQPYCLNSLENDINENMTGDQVGLYAALRIYLMLTMPSHYNQQAIEQWFISKWQRQFSNNLELQSNLLSHLRSLLKMHSLQWNENLPLIQKAQNSLKQLTLPELTFLELQEKYQPINVPVVKSSKYNRIDTSHLNIPLFYDAKNFSDIYNNAIPNADKTLAKGNWVLGTSKGIKLTPPEKNKLIKIVRNLYLQYYRKQWQTIATNIRLKKPNNLNEAQQAIGLITNKNSALNQLLKFIFTNATLKETINQKKTPSNLYFIKDFINKKGNYHAIKNQLNRLSIYLKKIQSSTDKNRLSFIAASDRFSNSGKKDIINHLLQLASQSQDPMQSWLNTIALSSWEILLKNTREYLNQVWIKTVIPIYNDYIENHYPIFKAAKEDISFKDFTNFFGPNGVIQNFFENYLQPFVNITKNYWVWNSLNGRILGMPQTTLDEFLRASLIQQMFFTNNQKQPNFRFNLVPTALSKGVLSFTLNIGGQRFAVTPGKQFIKTFLWPGKPPYQVNLSFVIQNKKLVRKTFSGPWAWFKCLDQSNLQATNNPKTFNLILLQEGYQANFKIYAENLINPFITGVLTQFRCPKKL